MSGELVTVIMSTFNEVRDIDHSIDSVLGQTANVDLVVVDGGSTDGTVERLRSRAQRDSRVTVHADGVRRSLPEALNLAMELTDRPFVAKVDARTFIAADFIERALEVFDREGDSVACVGGRPEQIGETRFGQAFARARMSPFGVGGSGYADSRDRADVDTVQCGIYRRNSLTQVGRFDPGLQFGEDEELNWRLRQAGYRIVRDTSIRFRYVTRPTWAAAFRQYRNYGRARVKVLQKHPEFIRAHHLVPPIALLAGAGLSAAAPVSETARRIAGVAFSTYAIGAVVAAVIASRDAKSRIPQTAAAFTALHLGYGIGLLEGFYRMARALPGTTPRISSR